MKHTLCLIRADLVFRLRLHKSQVKDWAEAACCELGSSGESELLTGAILLCWPGLLDGPTLVGGPSMLSDALLGRGAALVGYPSASAKVGTEKEMAVGVRSSGGRVCEWGAGELVRDRARFRLLWVLTWEARAWLVLKCFPHSRHFLSSTDVEFFLCLSWQFLLP